MFKKSESFAFCKPSSSTRNVGLKILQAIQNLPKRDDLLIRSFKNVGIATKTCFLVIGALSQNTNETDLKNLAALNLVEALHSLENYNDS
jgi:hypothetical protein